MQRGSLPYFNEQFFRSGLAATAGKHMLVLAEKDG